MVGPPWSLSAFAQHPLTQRSSLRLDRIIEACLVRAGADGRYVDWDFIDEVERIKSDARHRTQLALASLRDSVTSASPLLLQICDDEDLDLAAVAWGVLPMTAVPYDLEGHPWPLSRLGRRQSRGNKEGAGMPRRNGAIIRPYGHPAGEFYVRACNGVLHVEYASDGVRLRSVAGRATLEVRCEVPDTVLAALVGRPISALFEHRFLGDPDYVVTSVNKNPWGCVRIHFRCRPVPLSPRDRLPSPGREWQQIGRDGRLTGEHAIADVVLRVAHGMGETRRFSAIGTAHAALDQMWWINLMTPPWANKLEIPDLSAVLHMLWGIFRR